MSPGIDPLPIAPRPEPGLSELTNLKPLEQDALDLKKIDQLVEPGDEELLLVPRRYLHLAVKVLADIPDIDHQAEEGISSIGERLPYV